MIHRHFTRTAPRRASGVALAAALSVAGGCGASAGDLAIEIAGVHSEEGAIMVAVHGPETAGQFPDATDARYLFRLPALAGAVRLAVPGVAPGRYAIAAFSRRERQRRTRREPPWHAHGGIRLLQRRPIHLRAAGLRGCGPGSRAEPAAVRVTLAY